MALIQRSLRSGDRFNREINHVSYFGEFEFMSDKTVCIDDRKPNVQMTHNTWG